MTVAVERFREVPSHSVSQDERDAAYHVLACVTTALGLPRIRLRWFRVVNALDEWVEQRHGGKLGWHTFTSDERTDGQMNQGDTSEIWIRADRGPRRVATVVAHELKHVEQVRRLGCLTDCSVADIDAMHARLERDAGSFAGAAIEILLKGHTRW